MPVRVVGKCGAYGVLGSCSTAKDPVVFEKSVSLGRGCPQMDLPKIDLSDNAWPGEVRVPQDNQSWPGSRFHLVA